MFEEKLHISFHADWHTGSGLGDGHLADAILNRDHDGLPIITGRAIKGALREGAWRIALCRDDLKGMENYLWGTRSTEAVSNTPGRLSVGMGQLPQDMRDYLLACPPEERRLMVGDMTVHRSQTKLDANKMVVKHSLRTVECGIAGVCFESTLSIHAPELKATWLRQYLEAVCAAVKSMGADRARGLGTCTLRLAASRTGQKIILPPPCPLQGELS